MTDATAQEQAGEISVRGFLERNGAAIVRLLSGGDPVGHKIGVTTLRSNPFCRVLRVDLAGRRAVVKCFNRDAPQTQAAYDREFALARHLAGSDLSPRLLGANAEQRFLVFDHVPGQTLEMELAQGEGSELAPKLADQLGRWYVDFSDKMPVRVEDTTWFDYLSRYEGLLTGDHATRHLDMLKTLPMREMRIAKNDAHLSNFIRMEDGGLLGLDFESAIMKPFGWDILVTARVLARASPGQVNEIMAAILEGWGRGTDCIPREAFARVLTVFVLATAFDTPQNGLGGKERGTK